MPPHHYMYKSFWYSILTILPYHRFHSLIHVPFAPSCPFCLAHGTLYMAHSGTISIAKASGTGIGFAATMKISLAMAAFLGWFASAQAQPTNSFPLWPEGAPGALGKADKDIPTLTPYWPDPAKATGAAIVICPGGGYGGAGPARRRPLRAVPERIRHRGVRLEIPAGFRRLPASGDAAGCRPRGAVGARPGRRMEAGSQAHRHHGVFSGRPPCLDAADAL